jgi:hypothetical protein
MIEAFFGAPSMATGILIDQLGTYLVLSTLGIHRDLEILARAAEKARESQFAIDIRAMITLPPSLSPQQQTSYLDARATRFRQLNEALANAGRRQYRMGEDPVERLHERKCLISGGKALRRATILRMCMFSHAPVDVLDLQR